MRHVSPRRRVAIIAGALMLLLVAGFAIATDGEAHVSNMYATFWALVPPIIAIALALITKEVYSSLAIGIIAGALFHSNFNLELALNTMVSDGFIAKLADGWNVGILIFLVVLGVIVVVMQRAGGSAAYGRWAREHIKTKTGASFATFGLGVLIFVDDYFNCLTVGNVMRPITDTHKISRAKLSYLIDATAAPICMIAPISSWAAAVSGVMSDADNGLSLFISAIPYNFYSLLTIVMIIAIILLKLDFGPMKKHERNAENGDLFTTADRPYGEGTSTEEGNTRGRVYDLIIPVVILIVCCVIGMVYTGGFFAGENFILAFANCDAALGLALGSIVALVIIFIYYMIRRVISFRDFMSAIPEGFKAMVPAILILTFAWTLSAMTGLLGADVYVATIVDNGAKSLQNFLPAIIFLVAVGLAFATGTSWGTFGILLPIVVEVLPADSTLLIIAISACLAGAVCGDHCSPISDTTIMASTGAQCDHVNHVSTQLPYALLVAAVSFVGYILAGFIQSVWTLPIAIVILLAVLFIIRAAGKKKA
ncbi:MAG: Na+/H+ antiporter NhaC family protein [Clostridia bacterium]|nr:Na+/H+ antiporter NhaC family protein [Clostridia bacterium]